MRRWSREALRGWYPSLTAPPGTPPSWVFAPVWTMLYVMIGVAGWLVWRRAGAARPLRLWGWQLAANALWMPAFFGLHNPPLALAVIIVLLVLIAVTMHSFAKLNRIGDVADVALLRCGPASRLISTPGSGG